MGTVLSRTKTFMENALAPFRIILKRLAKRLHSHQYPEVARDSTSTSLVATTSNTHAASERADFSKLVTPSADEITLAIALFARPSAREGRSQHPIHRAGRPALLPPVQFKPGTHTSTRPLDDILQQGNVGKHISARASIRAIRASIPPSDYQKHVQQLEEHRVTLHRRKGEYGKARADHERSENTLQCVRRQGQHSLWVWRKQKKSAEGSLREMARKLRIARVLEKEMMIKINEEEKLLTFKGEKLAAWRRNGKDRWKEVSLESG